MKELKLLIDGKEIYMDPGYTITFEQESPTMELDSIITGGLAFDIRFPYGRNRVTMKHAERIEIHSRIITYTAQVFYGGELRVDGIFYLQNTETDAALNGFYKGSLVENSLQLTLAKPLSDLISKTVNLGSTPAAVIAAAKAQNAAAMSTNGTTGAVMKFVPHLNPEFYGDKNPDWTVDADWYDATRAYGAGESILYQTSGNVRRPKVYTAKVICAAAESPDAEPTQWEYRALGIINAWDTDGANFLLNELQFLANAPVINRTTLVPWLQIHDIIRQLATRIGYTVAGSYMADTIEQRALAYSNFAQDKRTLQRVIADLATQSTTAMDTFDKVLFTAKTPLLDYDPLGLWDDTDHAFLTSDEGFITFKISGTCNVGAGATGAIRLYFQVEDGINTVGSPGVSTTDGFDSWAAAEFASGALPFEVEFTHYSNLTGTTFPIEVWHYWTDGGVGHFGTITDVTIEVVHLTREGLNDPLGLVSYTNHMPALSGAEFLSAIATWKGLHIALDHKARVMRLDYRNDIINATPDGDGNDVRDVAIKSELLPKRRYEIGYANNPAPAANVFDDFDILDPVVSIAELPAPPTFLPVNGKFGKAALVQSESAYYITAKAYDKQRTEWQFAGHHTPAIQLDEEGDLVTITPDVGPVPMGRFWDADENELLCPTADGEGRSPSFALSGSRPPLLIAYWIGIDTSVVAAGYPYATTTARNAAGATVLSRDMAISTIFAEHWQRTLEMLVLEERYTAIFHLRPDQRKLLNFARALLLGHVPIIPIRTAEAIGGTSRAIEIEARKVKKVDVVVVGMSEIEIEPSEPQIPWTPVDSESVLMWIDPNNADKIVYDTGITIDGISDSTSNEQNLSTTFSNGPDIVSVSGIDYIRFDAGDSVNFLNGPITSHKIILVIKSKRNNGLHFFTASSRYALVMATGSTSALNAGAGTVSFKFNALPSGWSTRNDAYIDMFDTLCILQGDFIGQPAAWANSNIRIGGYGSGFDFAGDIGDIIQVADSISDEDLEKIEGYLAWKYALNGGLPVDHPYKLAAPTL